MPLPLPELNLLLPLLLPPLAPPPPPPPALELRELLVREEPVRGMCSVVDLGRSVGADLVRLLNVVDFRSVRRTLELDPAGLKKDGNSLLVELLPLRL